MTIRVLEFIKEVLPDPKGVHVEDFLLEAGIQGKTIESGRRAFKDWIKLLNDAKAEIDEEIYMIQNEH